MYTVISMGGRQLEALILSTSPERMRLAIPGRADIVEFRSIDGQWTSESGAVMELGAIFSSGSEDAGRMAGLPAERSRAAV